MLKTTRTVIIISLVYAFCRPRGLQQMILFCRYTFNSNCAFDIYHRNGSTALLNKRNAEILDRSLLIGWRDHSWNPERVSSVFTFVSVCVPVCTRPTEHTVWHNMKLLYGWVIIIFGTWKRSTFYCFSTLSLTPFL